MSPHVNDCLTSSPLIAIVILNGIGHPEEVKSELHKGEFQLLNTVVVAVPTKSGSPVRHTLTNHKGQVKEWALNQGQRK